jgi:hypothetical protein
MPPAKGPKRLPVPTKTRAAVGELVEHYRRGADYYGSPGFNEAQTRIEFIDPFFEALGWDIANRQGMPERFKDVIHEDSLKISGKTKAPDYCFCFGGQRVFYLEAKKPSVHIKDDPSPAFQLRRYGWNAKLPLSVLTDFQELAIYDCRWEPNVADAPATARTAFYTYDQYLDKLEDIYAVFSREAVAGGSLDRYTRTAKKHRGMVEVDEAILREISDWREVLAQDIARHNPSLSVYELNHAVQSTIDRILFLRIAEDRGVEGYGRLRSVPKKGAYEYLCGLYHSADEKYNAGLFNFCDDSLCLNLNVSDDVLRPILQDLYYPHSQYEFSVIPADILGAVYEQFLGKVIILGRGHKATVEEKPEVKKAGGVYYTPTYIVDYIVKHTVGEAAAEAGSPEKVAELRILDPACGSGSFLLGAYQYLLDWHLDYYTANDPARYRRTRPSRLRETKGGGHALTLSERKRILQSCIFGVDIDQQAVEVTKLNLLLKCMERVTEEVGQLQLLGHERVLPNIDENIKCGNSLIGPDYYGGRLGYDEDEQRRVNAFDWQREFSQIIKAGGFDCVIGNPPYLSFSGRQKPDGYDEQIAYWRTHYPTEAWPTSHGLFCMKACELRRPGGYAGFIVPDQVGHLETYGPLRSHLTNAGRIVEVRFWGEHVFQGVTTPALTFVLHDATNLPSMIIDRDGNDGFLLLNGADPWVMTHNEQFLTKLEAAGVSLGESIKDPGVHTGNCSEKLILPEARRGTTPVLEGKQIARYVCVEPTKYLNLAYKPKTDEYFRIGSRELYSKAQFVVRQTAAYPIVGPRKCADYFRNSLLGLYDWAAA